MIPIGAPDGVSGFDYMPSDDGVYPESKTDTGHECGMSMWFVDVYIGKSHRHSHLRRTQTMNDQTACTESKKGGNAKRRGSAWNAYP